MRTPSRAPIDSTDMALFSTLCDVTAVRGGRGEFFSEFDFVESDWRSHNSEIGSSGAE